MTASRFINFDPTGSSSLDIAYRNLGRYLPLNHRFNLRGVKDTKDTKYGQADGRFPYLNEETCLGLSPANVAFILGHEDYHLLLNHIQRMRKFEGAMMHWRGQNWSAANVGCDLIINPRLVKDNEAARGKMVKEGKTPYDIIKPLGDILIDIPELYDTREFIQCEETGVWKTNPDKEDLSSEELVAKLARLFPVPPVPITSGDQSDEDGDQSDEDGDQSDEDGDEEQQGGGSGSGDQSDEDGDEQQQGGGQSDEDGDQSGDQSGEDGDNDSTGSDGETSSPDGSGGGATVGEFGGGHDDFREPELEEGETLEEFDESNEEAIRKIIFEDKINETKGIHGTGSSRFARGDLDRESNHVPFAEHLRDWFKNRTDEGYDRPFCSKAYHRHGIIRRARGSNVAREIVFLVDTSASNVDKMGPMLDKIQRVFDEFQPRITHVVPCDTKVTETHEVMAGGRIPQNLRGGGGTRFKPAFDWVEENAPTADGIIYLTDGYVLQHEWDSLEEPQIPVLWLCFGYHPAETIGTTRYTFGERVEVELS